jgi:hypothetical protein
MGWYRKTALVLAWFVLSGLLGLGITQETQAREFREFRDARYQHNRVYLSRGQVITVLPSGHREIVFGKTRYFFFDGIWYRPGVRGYMVVAPPLGVVVPVLPPFYTTVWVGGVPYYYANEVYYAQAPGGYVIVQPRGEVITGPPPVVPAPVTPPPPAQPTYAPPPPPPNQVYIYPRQGQSPQQQAADRLECYNWAINQTGFDPARPAAGLPEMQKMQLQTDFQRAQGACLDGRGYTVR